MNKCLRCNVWVRDNAQVCPLCDSVLHQEGGEEKCVNTYPDVKDKARRAKRISRISMYVGVMIEVLLIIINYYTYSREGIYWSVITGGVFLYLILSVHEIIGRRTGHIRKIYVQMLGVVGLMLLIDGSLGFKGWSLEYGMPCAIMAMNLIIAICMIVNYANWENYVVMQLFTALLSIVELVLLFTGVVHHFVLVWVAFGISISLCSGTLIIGDRKATNELKRKFHI